MTRPGVEVETLSATPPPGVPTDTSVAFIVGEAAMGSTDNPTRITSTAELEAAYGDRLAAAPLLYDGVDAFFHEGGGAAYIMRLVDWGAAMEATGSTTAIITPGGVTLRASSPGTWGNGLSLELVAATTFAAGASTSSGSSSRRSSAKRTDGDEDTAPEAPAAPTRSSLLTYPAARAAGDFTATVTLAGAVVQQSQPLATVNDLLAFLNAGTYITGPTAAVGSSLAAGTAAFTGGADGALPVPAGAGDLATQLARIPADLGPGQVLAPGRADSDDQAALLAHAAATNRVALLDGNQGDGAAALTSAAATLRPALEARYGALWGPWATIPGLAGGTVRTVPWSAIQAGLCARVDAAGNPNQAAAGPYGASRYAIGLTQTFSPTDCEALLYAGVDTARVIYGQIEAYAFRTLVDPAGPQAAWRELDHARLAMALDAEADAVGQDFVFSQLDGRQLTLSAFAGDLQGMLLAHVGTGGLYTEPGSNDDPTTAYTVNVGPAVNTPALIADGILSAAISVRMSPHAELVHIGIVKVPITVTL